MTEIIDSVKIKNFLKISLIITVAIIAIPMLFYFTKFSNGLSDDKTDWGTFGDYFGGIIGTFFNLLAVVFSLLSIYISLKVAAWIYTNDEKINIENIARETERFKKEIEIIHKQNKPFLSLDIFNLNLKTELVIRNNGTGTMIVSKFIIYYYNDEYSSFGDLFTKKIKGEYTDTYFVIYDSQKYVIAAGDSKKIIELRPLNEATEAFINFQKDCKSILHNCTIKFFYEDIFDNKFEHEDKLNSFK